MLDKRNFYINGKWVKPSKSNDFEVINPSNEEKIKTKRRNGSNQRGPDAKHRYQAHGRCLNVPAQTCC